MHLCVKMEFFLHLFPLKKRVTSVKLKQKFLNHICIDSTIADHSSCPFKNPRQANSAAAVVAAAGGVVVLAVADASYNTTIR